MSCVIGFYLSWLPTEERLHVRRFVLCVPLTTLNQPRLFCIIRSRRIKGGVLWRARWYNGCPQVSPEQTCMLEKFPVAHLGSLAQKSTNATGLSRGSSLPTSRPNSVTRVSSRPFPPEQPLVVIPYTQRPSLNVLACVLQIVCRKFRTQSEKLECASCFFCFAFSGVRFAHSCMEIQAGG